MMKTFALATLAVLATGATASAAPIDRTKMVMATSICQSALPVFDGVVRKRPMAVQNEGTTATFITCGLEGEYFGARHAREVYVHLTNLTASTVTVSCTLVDAGNGLNAPTYLPKSAVLPANIPTWDMHWSLADSGGQGFLYPAISCNLPPGTGIKGAGWIYREEIGS